MAPLAFIALSLVAAATQAPQGQERWNKVSDSEGVQVWTRAIPESTMHEVKADMIVDATPEAVWSTLVAVHRYPDFLSNTLYARIMRTVSDAERFEYRRYTEPQISYYDEVLDVTAQGDAEANTYFLQWRCVPGETRHNVVRMNACHGAWAIEPTASGQTHVMYWNAVDPQGSIPSVLFNAAEAHDLPVMMRQVAKRAAAEHIARAY